jgi:hypothetical protein
MNKTKPPPARTGKRLLQRGDAALVSMLLSPTDREIAIRAAGRDTKGALSEGIRRALAFWNDKHKQTG